MRHPETEIRPSVIRDLLKKVKDNNYGAYLASIRLGRIRSFRGAKVEFDFPVTALIGPNGGGKTTILGAAACAYKNMRPRLFFPKSSIGDDTMANWLVEYELIDKAIRPQTTLQRTARFRNLKWVRDNFPTREVRYFGILRTVPAAEKTEFKKVTQRSFVARGPIVQIPETVAQCAKRILGKPLDAFRMTALDQKKQFYIGGDGRTEYSEFHFGAGEASVIRMLSEIERLPENSLVLIEEIENGLHPVATRRMVEYLIDSANKKKIQAMFTTHSDAALQPLPPEGIWAAIDGEVKQGKLSIEALRAISGRIDQRLAIFVEDDFTRTWLEWIIRRKLGASIAEIGVYGVAGDGNAVKTHTHHRNNPAINFRSLCFIDGDSQQNGDTASGVHRLPGHVPEATVFNFVEERLDQLAALLTVACQLAVDEQATVRSVVKRIANENRDAHTLFSQVGVSLGFVPEEIVRSAFITLWIQGNSAAVDEVVGPIKAALAD